MLRVQKAARFIAEHLFRGGDIDYNAFLEIEAGGCSGYREILRPRIN